MRTDPSPGLRGPAALLALLLLALLVVPLGGIAQAGHGTCGLTVTQGAASNVLGQQHTATATLSGAANCREGGKIDVGFEITGTPATATYSPGTVDAAADPVDPDLTCSINPQESACTVAYTRLTQAGNDSIRAFFLDATQTKYGPVTKTWTAAAAVATFLNVEPETDSNQPQTSHTLTVTVRDQTGAVMSGMIVDFEIMSGPNANLNGNAGTPDLTCTSVGNGSCTVAYTDGPTNPAAPNNVDTICGWLDTDNDNVFSVTGVMSDGGDCDAEAAGETDDSPLGGTDTFGNDATDKVTKTWAAAPEGRTIDCRPETATNNTGTNHVVTCTVRDRVGAAVAGEGVTFGSSGVGTLSATTATTNANGQATVTATSAQKGSQTITGTITDDLTGAEPAEVDECDRAANDPAGAPAGVCADSVTKTWTRVIRRASSVTIRHTLHPHVFRGRVSSAARRCEVRRRVVVKKVRAGTDRVVGRDLTNREGRYVIPHRIGRRGRYYAVATRKQFVRANGDTVICTRARSRTIFARR